MYSEKSANEKKNLEITVQCRYPDLHVYSNTTWVQQTKD